MFSWLHVLAAKMRGSVRSGHRDAEFDSEIQAHMQMLTELYTSKGIPAEEAVFMARRQFGNATVLKEHQHEQRSVLFFQTLWRQLTLAVRQLLANRLFTTVAVLSLALGIGANTSVFTVLDQLILRLLPVQHPERLVMIWSTGPHLGNNDGNRRVSYPMYQDFAKRATAFDSVFCRTSEPADFSTGNRSERVVAELVSGNYFQTLGAGPALGRVFSSSADDRRHMGHPVVVLTHAYWVSRFAADPHVIGRKVLVNKYPMEIVGVAAPNFSGVDPYDAPQIFVPIQMAPVFTLGRDDLGNRRSQWIHVFARLKAGYTAHSARASLQVLFHNILVEETHDPELRTASAYDLQKFLRRNVIVEPAANGYSELRQQYATALMVLMGMAALMLLVACSNVANLLIARAAARQKELAIHLAIGAGRKTLIGRLLVESVLLSLLGGAAGVLLAVGGSIALLDFIPESERVMLHARPDLRILLFTLVVSVGTAVIFGLAPALQGTRLDVWTTLKNSTGSVVGTSGGVRLRKALVVGQVALSFLLLAGAGLFSKSLANLKNINTGFTDIDRVYTFEIDAQKAGYGISQARLFYARIRDKILTTPGIQSASYAMVPVLNSGEWDTRIAVEGHTPKDGEDMQAYYNALSPGYWKTMGIPILEGRDFEDGDRAQTASPDEKPNVAIVNRAFAKHFFGNASPLGRRIGFAGAHSDPTSARIIGVTENTLYEGPRAGVHRQVFFAFMEANYPLSATFYVRAAKRSSEVLPALRGIVARMDPNIPIYDATTLDEKLATTLSTERLIAMLSIVFGGLATILAALGLYGVMAFVVVRRTKEIGLRIALGAKQSAVLWSVLREASMLMSIGIGIGVPIAYLLGWYASSQVFGVTATDPSLYVMAVLLLAGVTMASGFLPARRASAVAPTVALRYE